MRRRFRLGGHGFRSDFFGDDLDRNQKAVANSRHRLDVLRGLGRIAERLAELVDRSGQIVVEVNKDIVRPKRVSKIFAQDSLARRLDQERQDGQRLALDSDPCAELPQFAMTKVGFVGTKANCLLHFLSQHVPPAQEFCA